MLIDILQDIVAEKKQLGISEAVIKNFLKEYLQYPALDFIYNSSEYKNFIFTGGSCLRVCFNAPRLSEDLDFDLQEDEWKKFDLKIFGEKITAMFRNKYLLPVESRTQSDYRVYLKFSVLKKMGLAKKMDSDFLLIKIEPNQSRYNIEAIEKTSVAKFGFNFVGRNYKLSYMMVGKIGALFNRLWFKGDKNEIDIKGRDFYDLYWYLQNKIEPNWEVMRQLVGIANREELKDKILDLIDKKVTVQKLSYDLKNFFPEQIFVEEFCKNYKELISKLL